jgi:hypothetical protein
MDDLWKWAETILPDVLRSVAARTEGRTDATIRRGEAPPFRGGFIHYITAAGVNLRMWIYVSPAGAGYGVPGEPDAVYLQPDEGGKAGWRLRANFGKAFRLERDVVSQEAWRTWVPVARVRAAGPLDRQVTQLTEAFSEALKAAGLVEGP